MQPSGRHGKAAKDFLEAHLPFPDAVGEGAAEALADGFTRTGMTSYVQPEAEQLAQMPEGRFVSHPIDKETTTLDVEGDKNLSGLGPTGESVWAIRAAKVPRQLTTGQNLRGSTRALLRTIATTW
ncbi:hypothetical protein ACFVY0_46495 [Streptomyces sp. NPDC058286]|uniref:hypothetical protein n=1 Tax=Streptomyces sp. NPDC058286 TaxID=3346422 RepID=UPI0036EF8881